MIGVEATLLLVLLGVLALRSYPRGSRLPASKPPRRESQKGKAFWFLFIVFGAELAVSAVAFLLISLHDPHGEWDAWAIWNLHARFLFRGGAYWRDGFSPLLASTHPDYPLLLPTMIASCWAFMGRETVAVPIATALLFGLAGVGLAWASLSHMRSRSQGLLAGIVLLGAPYFIDQGAMQYADIPLAFLMLATLVLLCLQNQATEPGKGLTFLAGMATGCAMWMKNEGLLFGLVILAVQIAVLAPGRGWKAGFRQVLFFLGGLAPLGVLLFYFKTYIASPNDIVSALGSTSTAMKILNFSRYVQTLKAFALSSMTFGKGFWITHPLPILALYLIALGVRVEGKNQRGIVALALALGLTGAGYFMTYIVTPLNLEWQLLTSLNRLLIQLWPSFVFLFFLLAKTPEEALAKVLPKGG